MAHEFHARCVIGRGTDLIRALALVKLVETEVAKVEISADELVH